MFLRTNPAPRKWVELGFCPTQARVLFLLDQLPGKYYRCYLDNLFMSAKLCRTTNVSLKSKVMLHGVTRVSGRGLPKSIIQDQVFTINELKTCTGTTKAAVIVGDSEYPALIAFSVYDSKPVHFLSTVAT